MFVVNAQRWLYTLSQDPRMELARSCLSHLALEDQADPVRATQVEIITNQILDQSPTLFGVTKHLRPADFHLPDTQQVWIPCRAVFHVQRPGNLFDPMVEKRLNLLCVQLVTNLLQMRRVFTRQKTVTQRLKTDASFA